MTRSEYLADQHRLQDGRPPLGWYPQPAPFTFWSRFVDSNHPGYVFRVSSVESHFGDTALFDVRGMWHEYDDCTVIEYVSPETVAQIKQDNILKRLEKALGI